MLNRKKGLLADGALMLTTLVWGMGFVATEYAIRAGLSAAMILFLRFFVAALILGAAFWKQITALRLREWRYGLLAGLFLFLGFLFQTIGQTMSTPANSALLTTTNVLFVPFIMWAVQKKRPTVKNLLLPLLTLAGVCILSVDFSKITKVNMGDALVLLGALFFACHISTLGVVSSKVASGKLTFMQMATATALSLLYFVISDRAPVTGAMLKNGLPSVLYLGVFSTCLCFFLQTYAQGYAHPNKAAIILSMEGLFGSLFSVVLGLEPMRAAILIGGLLVLLSAVLTEVNLPARSLARNVELSCSVSEAERL